MLLSTEKEEVINRIGYRRSFLGLILIFLSGFLRILDFSFGFLSSDDNLTEVSNNDVFIHQGELIDFDKTEKVFKYYKSDNFFKLINHHAD